MVVVRFFPFDISYKVIDEKPTIHLFGRTSKGDQIIVLDDTFKPYFYVLPKESVKDYKEKLAGLKIEEAEIAGTEIVKKMLSGKEIQLIKVFAKLPKDIAVIKDAIKGDAKEIYETDIPFVRRYLIDKALTPITALEVKGEYINYKAKVSVLKAEEVVPVSDDIIENPRILAFDIETYSPAGKQIVPKENPILMIAFYGEDFEKVITWKKFKTESEEIEFVNSESEMIKRFKDVIEDYKPDIITGYFSDGFDFPYIKARADEHKIKLDLGLDYSEIDLGKKADKALITGIAHLDVFKFIRKVISSSLETTTYGLDAVAEEVLGEKKHDVDLDDLSNTWDQKPEELEKFCKYNLHDARLTFKLSKKILPNVVELIRIVGLPMNDVNRAGFSQLVEAYIMKQTPQFEELILSKPDYNDIRNRRTGTYQGAFVFEPKPGLYKDIAVFDFRSLYPTIISSHNISPGTLNCSCCKDSSKKAPVEKGSYWFCSRKKGFIPTVIENLITRRMRIKEIIKKDDAKYPLLDARQNSLKLLANSFYGYLAFFGARWYCIECARSVTGWGRFYIKKVIEDAQKQNFKVIYSDSLPYDRRVFVKMKNGDIRLLKIGAVFDKYRYREGISTLAFDRSGKSAFKPITRVIRHKYNGNLLKIVTKYGSTIVTPQHSVYSYEGGIKLVDAENLKKGDNLISVTDFKVEPTYQEGCIFDMAKMNLCKYEKELVLYKDNLHLPSKKGECPYCKKERFLSSHIHAAHSERKQKLDKKSSFQWVGVKNGKGRRIPRYWKLDNDLAWLLGFYCAEGSVSDCAVKDGRKCLLSFGSQDKSVIEKVKTILDSKTGVSTKIIKNYDLRNKRNMFYYRVQCLPIVALFQFGFGAGKGGEFKKVPWFIFSSEESLRKSFIQGYLIGDGNMSKDKRYRTHFIKFTTKSRELAEGLCFLLKTLTHGNNFWGKEIKHVAWSYRKDKPKMQSLRLQTAKESKGSVCLAEIKSIEELPNEEYVYDLEVDGVHNFVDAEGSILVHNTDSVLLNLEGRSKEGALKFAEAINMELPGLMELEFEGFYPSGLFVSAKAGPYGAKKKYALASPEGFVKIVGFETVRRNWSFIAREAQKEVLKIILKENDKEKALKYVKDIIEKLKKNEIPLEKVVIHTQLQKEIESYDAIGPHVKVAMRMKQQGLAVGPGSLIKFVITRGKERIGERARLPEEVSQEDYDASYYIENQVIPSVERIFEVLGYKKEDLTEEKAQSKLGEFI